MGWYWGVMKVLPREGLGICGFIMLVVVDPTVGKGGWGGGQQGPVKCEGL